MSLTRTLAALAATTAFLAAPLSPAVASDPATVLLAGVTTIQVQCDTGDRSEVLLDIDDATYDVSGDCGLVRITAHRADVTLPNATHLIVAGSGNVVRAKPIQILEVRGSDQQVSPVSVKTMVVSASGSTVHVTGLVEDLTVTGRHNLITAREGIIVRLRGLADTFRARKLDTLRVPGDRNQVTVTEGSTRVSNTGAANRISVHRRA